MESPSTRHQTGPNVNKSTQPLHFATPFLLQHYFGAVYDKRNYKSDSLKTAASASGFSIDTALSYLRDDFTATP